MNASFLLLINIISNGTVRLFLVRCWLQHWPSNQLALIARASSPPSCTVLWDLLKFAFLSSRRRRQSRLHRRGRETQRSETNECRPLLILTPRSRRNIHSIKYTFTKSLPYGSNKERNERVSYIFIHSFIHSQWGITFGGACSLLLWCSS